MYQRILVPYDGSEPSDHALGEAIRMARLTGATMRLIHVVNQLAVLTGIESAPGQSAAAIETTLRLGQSVLARGADRLRDAGLVASTDLVENFNARLADLVVADAQRWQADLIVIGTHGRRGLRRALLGSDAEQILRSAPAPVLLVRGPEVAGANG